jgi:hypothetical protein
MQEAIIHDPSVTLRLCANVKIAEATASNRGDTELPLTTSRTLYQLEPGI